MTAPLEQAENAAWNELLRQGVRAEPGTGDVFGEVDMVALVRAVLVSLREPSDGMRQAGAEIIRNVGAQESDQAHLSDAANTWRFMIDAAVERNERAPAIHNRE